MTGPRQTGNSRPGVRGPQLPGSANSNFKPGGTMPYQTLGDTTGRTPLDQLLRGPVGFIGGRDQISDFGGTSDNFRVSSASAVNRRVPVKPSHKISTSGMEGRPNKNSFITEGNQSKQKNLFNINTTVGRGSSAKPSTHGQRQVQSADKFAAAENQKRSNNPNLFGISHQNKITPFQPFASPQGSKAQPEDRKPGSARNRPSSISHNVDSVKIKSQNDNFVVTGNRRQL